jgi:hypothetical protein
MGGGWRVLGLWGGGGGRNNSNSDHVACLIVSALHGASAIVLVIGQIARMFHQCRAGRPDELTAPPTPSRRSHCGG